MGDLSSISLCLFVSLSLHLHVPSSLLQQFPNQLQIVPGFALLFRDSE